MNYIYSLNFKKKIDTPSVCFCLSVINSNIYWYNSESKNVLVYDGNGNLKEEIIINNVDGELTSYGSFIALNSSLLMTSFCR